MAFGLNALAVADFDGDSAADVATIDAALLSLLTNQGDGSLALTSSQQLSGTAIVAADFDGDGSADLAVAVSDGVELLLNDGHGEFGAPSHYATGPLPWSLAAGDLDDDGAPDLVIANSADDSLSLLRNLGDGTFAEAEQSATASHPHSVVLADLNGDGKLDAATANFFAETLSVFINQGDANFAPALSLASGPLPTALAAGDLTRDGRADLVVTNQDDHVSILVNQGNGAFAPAVRKEVGVTPYGVTLANVQGDAALDVITANFNGGVTILRNEGGGAYSSSTRAAGRLPEAVVAADLNGDGALEILVTNQGDTSVSVLAADGSKRSYAIGPSQYLAGDWSRAAASADFDADGDLDLVATLPSLKATRLLLNRGDATFDTALGPSTLGASSAIVAGDLDADGRPDLVVLNDERTSVSWYRNRGGASFDDGVELSTNAVPSVLALGDFDNDGRLDVALGTTSGVEVLFNRGQARFELHLYVDAQHGWLSLRAKDIDDDGFLDLLSADGDSARVFFGNGHGFASPQVVGQYFGATVADAGDFDADGRTDLVLAGESVNRVGLWRSLGGRAFVKSSELDSGEGPASLATADLDGDGSLDLLSASRYASVDRGAHVDAFLNDGQGRLAAPQSYFVAGNLHALLVGELDRDGRPDVVVAGVNAVSVLHNTCLPGERPAPPVPPDYDALERVCLQRPLSLRLVDADYSSSLDRIVVASELPSELVILDPRSGSDERIPLTSRPMALSVAPAGDTAIVQQENALSWVDLSRAKLLKTLPSVGAGEIVLGDDQLAYVFSATERAVHTVDLLNETSSGSWAKDGSGITLNAKRGVIYACSPLFGPVKIEEYGVGPPRASYRAASDVNPNLPYPPLFASVDGRHTFSSTGAVFYADPGQARNMRLETILTPPFPSPYGASYRFIGGDLANRRTYAIQGANTYLYGLLRSFEPEEQWLGVYDNSDLSYLGKIPIPCRIDQGASVHTYGRFVYSSSQGDRIYVLATTSAEASLAQRWGLAVLGADGKAL